MVDLSPQAPFAAHNLPLIIGDLTIDAVPTGDIYAITPFAGQAGAVSDLLKTRFGVTLSKAGTVQTSEQAELIWTGYNQWFLHPALPVDFDLDGFGAWSEQTDGWAVLSLRGEGAGDVMARLCPLDLRDFNAGQVARTEFAHMMSIILPRDQGYDIWVMRSYATTALEHLQRAADGRQAVKSLPS